ncbi:MAG: glycosyl hydrolase family 57 [Thermodesulfobacteriota bacterium]
MQLPEYIDGIPNISGYEETINKAVREKKDENVYLPASRIDFSGIKSAYANALHMHQPLIPAGGDDLKTAALINNLQYMMEHQDIGDNHNAPVMEWCYRRMGEFIPQLTDEGRDPRIMLEYSGTLLHGLRQMGADEVIRALETITCDPSYRDKVEWLGCPWGHAVAPSTPVQDYRLHVLAWQHHFAGLFGLEALQRVKGFSPSEMALPNHPDLAYEFVKTLKDCGFHWVLVQEHTVELPENGEGPQFKHLPHRMVCTSSRGESESIIAVIKTQGSDTKLVAQMQPYYEALSLSPYEIGGRKIPPLVTQIADGENGGVMMNEFPPKYQEVMRESSWSNTPPMNVTEYLEHLFTSGVQEEELPALQPLFQKKIWDNFNPGDGPERLAEIIKQLKKEDHGFHMEGGSWTNDISWVKGYDNVLGPMEEVSKLFYEKILDKNVSTDSETYRKALFHLMVSQTSCYRYWGEGLWTDYGKEICRRTAEIIK